MKINLKKIDWWVVVILFIIAFAILNLFYPILTPRRPIQENANIPTISNASNQTGEQVKKDCIDCKCNADDWFKDCCDNCEKTFDKPIDVVWTGEVATFMVSGEEFAIRKIPEDKKYPLFEACCLPRGEGNPELRGMVRITGKWTGIACNYVNTVFGQCVPYVEIEKIEEIIKQ